MKRNGVFVCIEGLDGSGKTTQTRLLVKHLRKLGYSAVYTREPSRGAIGKFIKKNFLHTQRRGSAIVEALLFAADRIDHCEKEILPSLNSDKLVLSDRYVYSSLAYQGATGLDLGWIESVNAKAVRPDLAIFIDASPASVMERLKPKHSVMENLATQRKVREIYLRFVERGDLVRVDGSGSRGNVNERILRVVFEFLKKS
jgi:dTMP kinase